MSNIINFTYLKKGRDNKIRKKIKLEVKKTLSLPELLEEFKKFVKEVGYKDVDRVVYFSNDYQVNELCPECGQAECVCEDKIIAIYQTSPEMEEGCDCGSCDSHEVEGYED
jgi:hypothetical protein